MDNQDSFNPQVRQREPENNPKRFGCLQVLFILIIGMLIAAAATFFIFKKQLFPNQFEPMVLSQQEKRVLDIKLDKLESFDFVDSGPNDQLADTDDLEIDVREADGRLAPEVYSEEGASRDINFTEKELNAMLASNTDLAHKVAIDLSDDLISAKILMPIDEDFPIMAGKTLRVRAGLQMAYQEGRPVVILKGVSVMGVPIPNAWLGNLKNIDLVKEFGSDVDAGFWKSFAEGVEYLQVEEGHLAVKLKE